MKTKSNRQLAHELSLFFTLGLAALAPLPLKGQITGGVLSPEMDTPGRPFSYFWHPTDVIGTLYSPAASEITPEGYINTGFGELMFFTGNPLVPVDQRIKTLYRDHLPCVEYWFERDGVRYEFSLFGGPGGPALGGLPVNYAKVQLRNVGAEPRTAFLSSGYRFSPHGDTLQWPQYRFSPNFGFLPPLLTEGQTVYNPNWHYSITDEALVRDGRILYFFPTHPAPWQTSLSLGDNGIRKLRYFTGEVEPRPAPLHHDVHTVMGVVTYRVSLQPGQSETLIFKIPLAPLPAQSPEAAEARTADYNRTFAATMAGWQQLVPENSPLQFPESKVQNFLLANTVFDLLAIDRVGDDYILSDNKFQYHGFYHSSSLMVAALDDMGLSELARKTVLYNLKCQAKDGFYDILRITKDGSWHARRGLPEGVGYALWGFKRHFALTGDEAFLKEIYPSVQRAMAWVDQATQSDPLGLLPIATVADDALLKDAHQTGQNFWTLAGIQCAVQLAQATGNRQDAARFESVYRRLWTAVEKRLAVQTAQTGGYIPPSLDRTLLGADWDNMHTLYPVPLFDPRDPRVEATIRKTRAEYAEGILTYPLQRGIAEKKDGTVFDLQSKLHYWHSTDNAMNQLVRGSPDDQKAVVADLYALLLHTSSTHGTQEFGAVPWSTRDYCLVHNIMPDGTTSAVMIELLRNMLVREYQDELHLFSALSPAWLVPGKVVALHGEPTEFGPIDATLRSTDQALEIQISSQFRRAPRALILHLPWFYAVSRIELDGRPAKATGDTLEIPAAGGSVKITGRIRPDTELGGYERAVENYKSEYRTRYARFLQTGEINN